MTWQKERKAFAKTIKRIIHNAQKEITYIDELLDDLIDDVESCIISKSEYKEQCRPLEKLRSELYHKIQDNKHALSTLPQ